MGLSFLEGNEAIAMGAVEAGCSFFAGYPITPATTIFNKMMQVLPNQGGICLQGEDEIASIGFCLGASMTGCKTMTATSGPGISLCSEQISFAIGSEIPIVIVDVQRLGPSTGSATLGSDGDIQFLQWGNSGGLPVIVLCPTNVEDCYVLTIEAFNLAEKYRCPVFIASNKEIAVTRESVDLDKIKLPPIETRSVHDKMKPFLPFETNTEKMVPDFLSIGDESVAVRQTSSTHGVNGYITTSPEEITLFQERLKHKLHGYVNTFSLYELYLEDNSNTLIICYGITAKSAKTLYNRRKNTKNPISLLILKTLWPVPETVIKEVALNAEKVVVPEMNLGLYILEIKRILKNKIVKHVGHMDGRLISPAEIGEELDYGNSSK